MKVVKGVKIMKKSLPLLFFTIFTPFTIFISSSSQVADWLAQPHAPRSIGAVYSDATAANYFMPLRARESFDLLLFVETTTSARKNPGR
jgi:hypothetical protein